MSIPSGENGSKTWIRFDPSISIGHLLTTIALTAAVVGWGIGIEKTITAHSERLRAGDETNARLERQIIENRNDIRETLKEIKSELKEITRRLENSKIPR
jgi:uncharacterized membrane protein